MPTKAAPSIASAERRGAASPALAGWRLLVCAAACAAYAGTLAARGWIRDDRWLVAENPLLRAGWSAAPRVFTTGYWEAALGASAPVHEYRPLLTLTFLAQRALSGPVPLPFHLVNLLLHAAACVLLLGCLRRILSLPAAGAAALLFAVLPVHAEAVSYVTSRSELLCLLSLLLCWRLELTGRARPAASAALLAAGLLSKESAVMIPFFLMAADWVFEGRAPWHPSRRAPRLAQLGTLAAWAALRFSVLPGASAGVPFFASRLDAAKAWPAWALAHYALPSLTGLGLCADFTRAGAGRSASATAAGVLAGLALLAAAAVCARGLLERRAWAFWAAAPLLFLLPTCPLLVPLDTIGAERFLYIPTLGLCAGLGVLYARALERKAAAARLGLAALAAYYAAVLWRRNAAWSGERAYYAAACACNPASARARAGLGEAELTAGQPNAGRRDLERAAEMDPSLPMPAYDLALLAYNEGRLQDALAGARRATALDPRSSDAWLLQGLAESESGDAAAAERDMRRALDILPDNAAARLDLGRLLVESGRLSQAKPHLARYLELTPGDPDAPQVEELLRKLP